MPRLIDCLRSVALAITVACLPVGATVAQDSEPPVTIGGFEYRFIPKGQIHMNLCRADSCGPGSKVSYVLYAPVENPDFDSFKRSQDRTVAALQARAREGTTITLEAPEQSRDELMTVFSIFREMRPESGKVLVTKSSAFFLKTITISVISSSTDKKTADANSALFTLGLITWNGARKNIDN